MNGLRKPTIFALGLLAALAAAFDYNLIIGVFGLSASVVSLLASVAAAAWISAVRQPENPEAKND